MHTRSDSNNNTSIIKKHDKSWNITITIARILYICIWTSIYEARDVARCLETFSAHRKWQDNKNARYYFITVQLNVAAAYIYYICIYVYVVAVCCRWVFCADFLFSCGICELTISRIFFWFLPQQTNQKSHTRARHPAPLRPVSSASPNAMN